MLNCLVFVLCTQITKSNQIHFFLPSRILLFSLSFILKICWTPDCLMTFFWDCGTKQKNGLFSIFSKVHPSLWWGKTCFACLKNSHLCQCWWRVQWKSAPTNYHTPKDHKASQAICCGSFYTRQSTYFQGHLAMKPKGFRGTVVLTLRAHPSIVLDEPTVILRWD